MIIGNSPRVDIRKGPRIGRKPWSWVPAWKEARNARPYALPGRATTRFLPALDRFVFGL